MEKFMALPLVSEIVAGTIAGITAALILSGVSWARDWRDHARDVREIRGLLVDRFKPILEATEQFHSPTGETIPEDRWRAFLFNSFMTRVGVVLERDGLTLSGQEREQIYDALDWHRTEALHLVKSPQGNFQQASDIPKGFWVGSISRSFADAVWARLQTIGWLGLD